ncbi:unnamed protein product, partial [Symbiodinium microadriaticum]
MVCGAPSDGAASDPVGSEASSGGEEELIIPEDDPVIEQLKDILDEWSRGRPDGSEISRDHDLYEPFDFISDEEVEKAFHLLAPIVAAFGKKVPNASKIKSALCWLNREHLIWPVPTKKKVINEWSQFNAGTIRARAVYLVRLYRKTEKVQILKDILASWEDGGEESDASELSDSAPSDSGDDGSDAASVDEGDAAEGHIVWSPVDIKSLQAPAAAGAPVEPAAMEPAAMAEGSPDELTALELQEVEAEAPPEDDDMDHGRSSEQALTEGAEEEELLKLQSKMKTLAAVAVAVVVVAVEGS